MRRVVVELINRSVLRLCGNDSALLLQSTTTNDINKLTENNALYTLLLNSRGRIVEDLIIYKRCDDYFIECDKSNKDKLAEMLYLYKMHKKVKISESRMKVFHVNDGSVNSVADPRVHTFGSRLLSSSAPGGDLMALHVYNDRRYEFGIAEGIAETMNELPVHMNADIMHGIGVNKGCYIGQELTARSINATSVIRKRVLPFTSEGHLSGVIKMENGEEAGRVLASNEKRGLALLRLDSIANNLHASDGPLVAFRPSWWPTTIINI